MKAVIKLDVPEWQIGQEVSVYFPDTMMKYAKCELLTEQEDLLRKLQSDKDKLCLEVSKWKHKFHDAPPKFVSQGVVDQIRWERDAALSQLEEIGKGLGSKMDDIVAMLKGQEANWTKCTDRTPDKDGEYLVVKSIMGMFNKIDVCAFALNLHEIDEFDFPDEERPGWYEHDSETGYFEWTGITHWAELPKMPNGIDERSVKGK